MNILISGWYGFGNTGDELLLDIFLSKYGVKHNIKVLTQGSIDPKRVPSIYHNDFFRFDSGGIKQWLTGNPLKLIFEIFKSDVFVLGGGGIIREAGNFQNLRRLLDEIWLAKVLGKKVFIYGVSIGPIASSKGKNLVRKSLKRCDFITVRDMRSLLYLQEFDIDKSKYSLCPDPAFIKLTNSKTIGDPFLRKTINVEKKIPIFLSLGLIDDGRDFSSLDSLARVLDKLSIIKKLSFIAIPFRITSDSSVDDIFVAHELHHRLVNKSCLSSKWVLAVRLHSMILSIANNTPFVAINYDTKVRDTAILANLDNLVVDLDNEFEKNLLNKILNLEGDLEKVRAEVTSSAKILSENAKNIFTAFDRLTVIR